MNFVFISPNFPERYYKFTEALKRVGFNVLGIGDCPYNNLHPRTRNSLTEYYACWQMENIYSKEEALRYFENKYGHIDYLESNNEYWLESDSHLREKFNITTGQYPQDMLKIQSKIEMKKYFEKAGAKVARYIVADDFEKCKEFISKVGYPTFIKPVVGVGAQKTYKIKCLDDLINFFNEKDSSNYMMEEYLDGEIVSFDGVCNSNSEVVFAVSEHFPTPIDIVLNNQQDNFYYCDPNIPSDFYEIGTNVVKSFGIKKRYFHIEFFKLKNDKEGLGKKGDYIALECNMRAPGGTTPDLINFASSVSSYDIWADVMMFDENRQDMSHEKYIAMAFTRRDRFNYVNSDYDICLKYHNNVCMSGRTPAALADALGDSYFYAKFKNMDEAMEFVNYCSLKY